MRAAVAVACRVRRSFGSLATMRFSRSGELSCVGSDRCAGKKLYATKIFAEIFDYDFVFAEDFLDDQTDLTIANIATTMRK